MLITNVFFFSHFVFKSLSVQGCENLGLCGKSFMIMGSLLKTCGERRKMLITYISPFPEYFQSFPIQNSAFESPIQCKIKRDKLCGQSKKITTKNQLIRFQDSLITLIFTENSPKSLYIGM